MNIALILTPSWPPDWDRTLMMLVLIALAVYKLV